MIRTVRAAMLLTAATLPPPSAGRPVQATTVSGHDTRRPPRPAACARITAPPPESAPPTSVNTLRQAYECVLDNYYSGPVLDSKVLLRDALAAYTQELMRRGADKAGLRLPALTGNRDADWAAFAGMIGTGDPAALRARDHRHGRGAPRRPRPGGEDHSPVGGRTGGDGHHRPVGRAGPAIWTRPPGRPCSSPASCPAARRTRPASGPATSSRRSTAYRRSSGTR